MNHLNRQCIRIVVHVIWDRSTVLSGLALNWCKSQCKSIESKIHIFLNCWLRKNDLMVFHNYDLTFQKDSHSISFLLLVYFFKNYVLHKCTTLNFLNTFSVKNLINILVRILEARQKKIFSMAVFAGKISWIKHWIY